MVRSLFARALSLDTNLRFLYQHLPPDNPQSAPALAFLALVVKDSSAINESIALYSKACELMPGNASYTLNLIHTLELDGKFELALKQIERFCHANPAATVRSLDRKVGNPACSIDANCRLLI